MLNQPLVSDPQRRKAIRSVFKYHCTHLTLRAHIGLTGATERVTYSPNFKAWVVAAQAPAVKQVAIHEPRHSFRSFAVLQLTTISTPLGDRG